MSSDEDLQKIIHYAVKSATLIGLHDKDLAEQLINTLHFEDALRVIGVRQGEKPYDTYVRLRKKYRKLG